MTEPMFMLGGEFDRAAVLREDEKWIAARLSDPNSRFLAVWRNRSLIADGEPMRAAFLQGAAAQDLLGMAEHTVLLSVNDGVATFAVDVSGHEEDTLAGLTNGGAFLDLRESGPQVDAHDGTQMAHARGMMYWHRYNRFCGACGAPTHSMRGGHMRKCMGEGCGRSHFPRTDPAVIMLITRPGPGGGYCLLGRQAVWPEGRFSTLAGFVEPGETLEDAVAREVDEETGIKIADVRYQKSQPWPFPASLMLGFRGRAVSDNICLNDNELEDAQWFTKDQVTHFEDNGFHLPRMGSISRWLIASWVAEGPDSD